MTTQYPVIYTSTEKHSQVRALHPNGIYLRNMCTLGCTVGGWGWQNSGSKVGSKHMPLWMQLKRVQVVSETMVTDSCLCWNNTSSHFHHKFKSSRALTNWTWEDAQRWMYIISVSVLKIYNMIRLFVTLLMMWHCKLLPILCGVMSGISNLDSAEFTEEAGRKFALYCHYAIVVGSCGGYDSVFFQTASFYCL